MESVISRLYSELSSTFELASYAQSSGQSDQPVAEILDSTARGSALHTVADSTAGPPTRTTTEQQSLAASSSSDSAPSLELLEQQLGIRADALWCCCKGKSFGTI